MISRIPLRRTLPRAALLSCVLLAVIAACDKVVPPAEKIAADPSLAPFNLAARMITPISFNVDTNRLEYSYSTELAAAPEFFARVDAKARATGWHVAEQDERSHVYTKIERISATQDAKRVVRVSFIAAQRQVRVVADVSQWITRTKMAD